MRLKCLEPVILSVEYATDEGRHKCECLKLKCLLQLYLINVHRTVLLFSVLNVCQTRVKTRFGSCSYVTSWNRKTIRTCGKRCISTSTLSNQVLMMSSPCHELCDDDVTTVQFLPSGSTHTLATFTVQLSTVCSSVRDFHRQLSPRVQHVLSHSLFLHYLTHAIIGSSPLEWFGDCSVS